MSKFRVAPLHCRAINRGCPLVPMSSRIIPQRTWKSFYNVAAGWRSRFGLAVALQFQVLAAQTNRGQPQQKDTLDLIQCTKFDRCQRKLSVRPKRAASLHLFQRYATRTQRHVWQDLHCRVCSQTTRRQRPDGAEKRLSYGGSSPARSARRVSYNQR